MVKENTNFSTLLSDFVPPIEKFPQIEEIVFSFLQESFLALPIRKRFKIINQTLYRLLSEVSPPCFLFGAVLDFLDRINRKKILQEPFHFTSFEFWLNHFSGVTEQENYEIRAKIAGKNVPRTEYHLFPIGMNSVYWGTHFVAAHLSPDIDTMIASFWSWMDAFAARIGSGLHIWCLPGGPPLSPFTYTFQDMFGSGLFTYVPRTALTITLTAMDLVNQKHFTKQSGDTRINFIDHSNENAVILTDQNGHYLGDWRSADIESVRQIIILFKSCLHWLENTLHTQLIALFAKEDLSIKDLPDFYESIFGIIIRDCGPVHDFTDKQKNILHDFFLKIMGVEKGLGGTFKDLNQALDCLSIPQLLHFQKAVEHLGQSGIFKQDGLLEENRPKIFTHLKLLIGQLDQAIFQVRNYVERLDVMVGVKHIVLGLPHTYISLHSDVDEIRLKIQEYDFLTVVIQEQDGSLFPVGIVHAHDVRKNVLGTISLRDFCNLEEVKMGSYLEPISIVDHHKTSVKTSAVPAILTGDVQSCNVFLAEQAFILNDRYSTGAMTIQEIEEQIKETASKPVNGMHTRILQRLLQRRLLLQTKNDFYIHPTREFDEYMCFLQAILDDTDLLSKVSSRDLFCVAQLLNRLKSLSLKQEVEIIHFDEIPKNKNFCKLAAEQILKQADMYSIYKKIYDFRESDVSTHLELCLKGHPSNIFMDTKEQNGCNRVGQTKIFASNFPYFLAHADEIRECWLKKSQEIYLEKAEIDFHIHMISTIANAEEVYKSKKNSYTHQDELWFWTPALQSGYNHLNSFLATFQHVAKPFLDSLSIEFRGKNTQEYQYIFNRHFPNVPITVSLQPLASDMVIVRFAPGELNSRKSKITPYLPHLIS